MSFNNHEKTLAGKFDLKADNDTVAFSGCTGYGYDRLIFGVL